MLLKGYLLYLTIYNVKHSGIMGVSLMSCLIISELCLVCDVINSDIVKYTARHCMLTSSLVMSLLISDETLRVLFKSSCVYNSCSSLSP